ncbi:hypothetical protein L484_008242 [Morus notabilis]|uniref:Uncharacterized protein n=1 Tax=Morus notabilis TaxID=981085 RepID=W9QYC7_9ROSA|nr:hypothetical protein L484_008242 [Morus notabilis]
MVLSLAKFNSGPKPNQKAQTHIKSPTKEVQQESNKDHSRQANQLKKRGAESTQRRGFERIRKRRKTPKPTAAHEIRSNQPAQVHRTRMGGFRVRIFSVGLKPIRSPII